MEEDSRHSFKLNKLVRNLKSNRLIFLIKFSGRWGIHLLHDKSLLKYSYEEISDNIYVSITESTVLKIKFTFHFNVKILRKILYKIN